MTKIRYAYTCTCGAKRFHFEDRRIRYRTESRYEPVLVCSECKKVFNIAPCNTNGLEASLIGGEKR